MKPENKTLLLDCAWMTALFIGVYYLLRMPFL